MKWNNVAILGAAATAYAQDKAPEESAPEGCKASYDGTFTISVVEASGDSSKLKRDGSCPEGSLLVTLKDGVLKDAQDRTGNIVANYQFQFDAPLQDNAIYTSGFSVCDDRTLAIGGNKTFYQCLSGDFYNLYDRDWAEQCKPINIITTSCSGGGSSGGEVPPASQIPDGQVQAPSAVPLPVSQIGDGQVQVPSGAPVSQIPDGQVQAPTGAPVSQIPDGQVQAPTGAPVSQIPDGQVQAPTGAPVSQIPDGQVQAPTGAPVSQIPDGQVQAPTGAPVSQIPDGQVQAPTGAPVSQIPDGQVQAPTGAPISQIGDGQIQAPTAISTATIPLPPATTPAPSPTPGPVGGALQMAPSAGLLVAALGAVLLL
jgi:hypothetical protein